jgi:hypothetical protein
MNTIVLNAVITTMAFVIPVPILSWLDRPKNAKSKSNFN